jgi:small subunit ribosomal protein S8
MAVSDPVADFLTIIRNGCKAKKETVTIPSSKLKGEIAEILKQEGFIKNYKIIEDGTKKQLRIYLKYLRNGKSAIKNLQKVSRPGLRRYTKAEKIPRVFNGMGVMIVSTSQGLMSDATARKDNIGGEMICKVW